MSKTPKKTVKDPTRSNATPWFIAIAVILAAVLIAGAFWYTKSAPTKADNALDRLEEDSVDFSLAIDDDGVITLENDPKPEAKTINLYEDYTCIYCSKLAIASDADLKEAVEDGDIILNIHEMNFLDRGEIGNSTRTLAPAIAMAEAGDAEQYWNYRKLVYEEFETVSGNVGSDDELDTALIDAGFDKDYIAAAKDDEALKHTDETAAKSIASLEEVGDEVSSPRVFWDDNEIDPQNPDWVKHIVEAKGSTLEETQDMDGESDD